MEELFNPNLLTSKLIIITFIEVLILIAILALKRTYKEKLKILIPLETLILLILDLGFLIMK